MGLRQAERRATLRPLASRWPLLFRRAALPHESLGADVGRVAARIAYRGPACDPLVARRRPRPDPPAPQSHPPHLQRSPGRRPHRPSLPPRALPLARRPPQHHHPGLPRPRRALRGSGAGAGGAVPADGGGAELIPGAHPGRRLISGCGEGGKVAFPPFRGPRHRGKASFPASRRPR
jgi:hypothetical protein